MVDRMPVAALDMGVLGKHHGGVALSPRDSGACSQTQHLCCGHLQELEHHRLQVGLQVLLNLLLYQYR